MKFFAYLDDAIIMWWNWQTSLPDAWKFPVTICELIIVLGIIWRIISYRRTPDGCYY